VSAVRRRLYSTSLAPSDAESVALPMTRWLLLVSVPPILRVVPPSPEVWSTHRWPASSRKVATVFVPADPKEKSDELVIELTVPIEAEATDVPLAITTSEFAPETPTGLQLSGSCQSELIAPVHVDLLRIGSPH
jgi:hypothetical protein